MTKKDLKKALIKLVLNNRSLAENSPFNLCDIDEELTGQCICFLGEENFEITVNEILDFHE